MKINLIIQGPCYSNTDDIIKHYSSLNWVDKIIFSSWENNSNSIYADENVKSKILLNNGLGNRNAQIVTSLNGLKVSNTEYSAKLRSDQKISIDSMNYLYKKMFENKDKILTLGFYKSFPFHPRDHSFWGKTSELIELFNIKLDDKVHEVSNPHDDWPNKKSFYSFHLRTECYIVAHYLAKKDERVKNMLDNYTEYLTDFAPQHSEALELDKELMQKYFALSAKINFEWPKHNLKNYHYDFAANFFGEFWDLN
jgi:hypothetical protein